MAIVKGHKVIRCWKCFLGHLLLTANLCFLCRTTLCWKPCISIKPGKIIPSLFENKDRERWGLVAEKNCIYRTDQGPKFCLLNGFWNVIVPNQQFILTASL